MLNVNAEDRMLIDQGSSGLNQAFKFCCFSKNKPTRIVQKIWWFSYCPSVVETNSTNNIAEVKKPFGPQATDYACNPWYVSHEGTLG